MLHEFSGHRLLHPLVEQHHSDKHKDVISPDTIVLHYTAAFNSTAHLLDSPNVSAHFVVRRDGTIDQLFPCNIKCWHAGRSVHKGRKFVNNFSIGIEIENLGIMNEVTSDGGFTWFKKFVFDKDLVKVGSDKWHKYNGVEIGATFLLCSLLIAEYGIKDIVGHSEIASGRKVDPGVLFPLDSFRKALL